MTPQQQQEVCEIGKRFGLVDHVLTPDEVQQAMLDAYPAINEASDAIGLAVNAALSDALARKRMTLAVGCRFMLGVVLRIASGPDDCESMLEVHSIHFRGVPVEYRWQFEPLQWRIITQQ